MDNDSPSPHKTVEEEKQDETQNEQDETRESVRHLFPDDFALYSFEVQVQVISYLSQLSRIEKKSCAISKNNLESCYSILKSNGFIQYINDTQQP